ncbi:MAG: response regulator transcription factor [Pirellulales bacterium]
MRVLVVEDDVDLSSMLTRALRAAGFAVDAAVDGDEGLAKARSWDYDAIVLDLMLPKRDGFSLLAELRKERATPMLILTARDTVGDRVLGLDSGADDYLVKPFDLSELMARLRAMIRRAAGQSRACLEIGSVSIDTAARVVSRAGVRVALTAREYSLVELLALNRGKLVTKSMIYDHLYDENEDTLSNLIEVHVSNVRKKLGHDFIATRRGQGYVVDG